MGCVEPDPTTVKIVPEMAVLKEPDNLVVPATFNLVLGVVVPIPILPLEFTNKKLVEPEVTWKEAVPGETDAETDPVAI